MADGKWIDVPGKGRRWQMPSGELRFVPPTDSFLDLVGDAFNVLGRGAGDYLQKSWNAEKRRSEEASRGASTPSSDPLARRRFYMGQVPGPERSMDMDAPVPGLTMDSPVYGSTVVPHQLEYRSGYQSQPVTPVQPQYKIYPTTPEGQYERYFKTPELDYVFGAGARQGDEAPKDAAAMQILGNQLTADPESKNIASMYAAQSAMGRVNMPEILKMYEGNKNMQEWARENPMLAQREFLKARAREAADMPVALDQETVVGDLGSRAQGEGGWSYPEKTEAEATAVEEAKAKLLRQAENQRLQAGGFESRTPGLF